MMPPMVSRKNQKNCVGASCEVVAEEGRRRQDVEEHAVERARRWRARAAGSAGPSTGPSSRAAGGRAWKGWRWLEVQRLGQQLASWRRTGARRRRPGTRRWLCQPGVHEQEAADDRRDGRRHAEVDGHLAHHALRLGGREHVADDGARHHDAGAGREALQGAEQHQLARWFCDSAQPSEASVNTASPHSTTRPAAEAVGQRAVEQVHEGKAEQVGRQRLLHLGRTWRRWSAQCPRRRGCRCRWRRARACPARRAARPAPSAGPCQMLVGIGIHGSLSPFFLSVEAKKEPAPACAAALHSSESREKLRAYR